MFTGDGAMKFCMLCVAHCCVFTFHPKKAGVSPDLSHEEESSRRQETPGPGFLMQPSGKKSCLYTRNTSVLMVRL